LTVSSRTRQAPDRPDPAGTSRRCVTSECDRAYAGSGAAAVPAPMSGTDSRRHWWRRMQRKSRGRKEIGPSCAARRARTCGEKSTERRREKWKERRNSLGYRVLFFAVKPDEPERSGSSRDAAAAVQTVTGTKVHVVTRDFNNSASMVQKQD
jgi:hypothetical protein